MDLAKVMRVNQLLGFYGGLLTDKQQAMLGLYYEEDFSLAEIADHYDISRQAVRDNLKRAEQTLEHYEAPSLSTSRGKTSLARPASQSYGPSGSDFPSRNSGNGSVA